MRLEDTKKTFDHLTHEMNRVIVGMDEVIKQMVVSLLTNSHAILEGYPGLAKTLSIKTMAQLLSLKFSRIQNTPDLMPSDITGTYIIEETTGGKRTFKFQPGPVFAKRIIDVSELGPAAAACVFGNNRYAHLLVLSGYYGVGGDKRSAHRIYRTPQNIYFVDGFWTKARGNSILNKLNL